MNESIGNRISKFRKAKGLTQESLANLMGVSSQAVSKWETDASCPDISALPQLCRILGITADELLTGKTNEVKLLPAEERKSLDQLTLRIKVDSAQGDKVRVNLPFGLLKALSGAGVDIAAQYSGVDALKGIDMEKILEMVENGTVGKIVEVESADGDTVEIVVE